MVLHLTSCVCLGPVYPSFIPPAYAIKGQDKGYSRVLEIIRECGSISRHSLTAKTQYLNELTRNAILSKLVKSGQVTVENIRDGKPGRPSQRYSAR